MPSPPALTEAQKRRLATLEPALRKAVYVADYEAAKAIATDLQDILRSSGHETRLMRCKVWLFEAALNAGELQIADAGLQGVCAKTASSTRIHLEAISLRAICQIRLGKLTEAERLIERAITSKAIRDLAKRRKFIQSISHRFQLEGYLFAARGQFSGYLDPKEVDAEAIQAVRTKSDDELYSEIAIALPRSVIEATLRIDRATRLKLTYDEVLILPSPAALERRKDQGKTFFQSLKLVVWKSLCDPKSEIYQAWFTNGISHFFSKKYYAIVVTSALVDLGLAAKAIAVPATALLMKVGIEVYCERYRPGEILDERAKSET
ncbi:hypothetical protein [Paracidovorax avenae]|uniref:hypothetical protein n=1 Tax=Paracidovorax avenae TaxID=80867 RepID=UPI00126019B8|nr:hypothetical protein [Paracidovorax avenae]